jgi:AraC family transcriptional regulator of adaptative response/methylated-DNA-[protein]-cysteine methyltransferase
MQNLQNRHLILKSRLLETPIGQMLAIANNKELHLLQFLNVQGLEQCINRLCIKQKADIINGLAPPIDSIKLELALYFSGKIKEFKTPIHMSGSSFQKKTWEELINIPYGKTRSYKDQADFIGNIKAVRASANANAANQLIIIIPCHRVINNSGALGGYSGGLERKKYLIDHERKYYQN